MEIDISDIGRPAALAALYNASRPQGLGLLLLWTEGEREKLIQRWWSRRSAR